MRKFRKILFSWLGLAILFLIFVFTISISVHAATTPSLGAAATYGVLAGTFTNTSATTTVNGDIGFTTGPATVPLGVHTNYGSGAPTPTARIDAANALNALNAESCDFNFGSVTDLSLLAQPLVPGVYCIAAAASIGTGGITLNGAGTYIFRITGALTTTNNSIVTLTGGASASDVFWTPTAATTLGANTEFKGTIIDNANAITAGSDTVWVGRAISLGAGTVTTDTNTITVPTTLRVTKTVVNDNGGTKVIADFPLFIDGSGVTSGVVNTTTAGLHTVSETADAGYTTVI
ncbi:MAG: ice-binding family protein, partial [Candidatus Uhrbacteria bacterium]|nr:ice-binding family protein [Candidatus Uhrbacteria bacterium]